MRLNPNRASILKVRHREKGRSMMPVRMTTDANDEGAAPDVVAPRLCCHMQIDYADDPAYRECERNKGVYDDGFATKIDGRDGVVGSLLVVSQGHAVGESEPAPGPGGS